MKDDTQADAEKQTAKPPEGDKQDAAAAPDPVARADKTTELVKKLIGLSSDDELPADQFLRVNSAVSYALAGATEKMAKRVTNAIEQRQRHPEKVTLLFASKSDPSGLEDYGKTTDKIQDMRQELNFLGNRVRLEAAANAPDRGTDAAEGDSSSVAGAGMKEVLDSITGKDVVKVFAVAPVLAGGVIKGLTGLPAFVANIAPVLIPALVGAFARNRSFVPYAVEIDDEQLLTESIEAFKDHVDGSKYTIYDMAQVPVRAEESSILQGVLELEADLDTLENYVNALEAGTPGLKSRVGEFVERTRATLKDLRAKGGDFPDLAELRSEDALVQQLGKPDTFSIVHGLFLSGGDVRQERRGLSGHSVIDVYVTLCYTLLDNEGKVVTAEGLNYTERTDL